MDGSNSSTLSNDAKILAYHWSFLSYSLTKQKPSGSRSSSSAAAAAKSKPTPPSAAAAVVAAPSSKKNTPSPLQKAPELKVSAPKEGEKRRETAPNVEIVTPEKAKTAIGGLTNIGDYEFQLTITDDKKHVAKDKVGELSIALKI